MVVRWALLYCLVRAVCNSGIATRANQADGAVQKVIELLQDNLNKVKVDLDAGAAEIKEYSAFCDAQAKEKGLAVKTATRQLEDLDARIIDGKATVTQLDDEISFIGTALAGKDRDLKDAKALWQKQKDDFDSQKTELQNTVDQLVKAISLMRKSPGTFLLQSRKLRWKSSSSRVISPLLVQALRRLVDAAWIDEGSMTRLKGFLQANATADADGTDVDGDGVLGTLQNLKEQAQEVLESKNTVEMKSTHNHEMMVQNLNDAIALGQENLHSAQAKRAEAKKEMGEANGEKVQVTKSRDLDSIFLEELKHKCREALETWQEREKSGQDEMTALEKAHGILAERVKTLVQTSNPDEYAGSTDDFWVTTSSRNDEKARKRLLGRLKVLGKQFHSYAMMELISAATADPLEQVRNLISDMIGKLQTEGEHEITQKEFCDEESAKSEKTQKDKGMRLDVLQSRLYSASSALAKLEEVVRKAQTEVAEIDKADAKAEAIRQEEHATALQASKDFKGGAAAIREAIGILKEFYDSAGKAESTGGLLQVSDDSSTHDQSTTIISILENSGSEFTKMFMEIEAQENEAVDSFEELQKKSKALKAAKLAEIRGAHSEIKSLTLTRANTDQDAKMTAKELDAVDAYIDKLKPQCEDKVETYEEERQKRLEEIDGLKEALSILDSEASMVQTKSRH